jgi:hypothetical protein
MKSKLFIARTLALALIVIAHPAFAHHSSASYEVEHIVSLKGTVTNFEWSNPHTFIYLDAKDEKGNVTPWRVEANSPNMLTRVGWKRDMIKAGDQVSVSGAPARNGAKVMRLSTVKLSNGQEFDGQGFK